MRFTLPNHIVVEHVGRHLFLMDSVRKEVYSLPLDGTTRYVPETGELLVGPSLAGDVEKILAASRTPPSKGMPRRTLIGSTGLALLAGVTAMSFPTTARASSGGQPDEVVYSGEWFGGPSVADADPNAEPQTVDRITGVELDLYFRREDVPALAGVPVGAAFTVAFLEQEFVVTLLEDEDNGDSVFLIDFDDQDPNWPAPGTRFYDFFFDLWYGSREREPFEAVLRTAGKPPVRILFEPGVRSD